VDVAEIMLASVKLPVSGQMVMSRLSCEHWQNAARFHAFLSA
jgi:hypothetical protein